MTMIEAAITNWWGERCPETVPGCPCCDAWIEYDALTKREPVAVRHSFDGDGWLYADAGNGADWLERAMSYDNAEQLYE